MKLLHRVVAASAIRVIDGKAASVKGKHTASMLRDVESVCADLRIRKGEVWIDGRGRLSFSREIPKEAHQRMRNIITGVHGY